MTNQIKNFILEGEKEFDKEFVSSDGTYILDSNLHLANGDIINTPTQLKQFISSRQISLIKMIVEMVESEKKIDPIKNGMDRGYNPRAYDRERKETIIYNKGNNQALDIISSKLSELTDGK